MGQCFSDIPSISMKDCCQNVKCNSECSSSCCMFRSKAKNTIKHKHHKNKIHGNSNDKATPREKA